MSRWQPWIAVLVWAGVIFTFSTNSFSGAHTGRYIMAILHIILPHARNQTLLAIHAVIRKSAHFIEYFVFGLLLLRAVQYPEHGWKLRWAILAVAIAAVYAASDEFHQVYVPGRTASPWDSLLDTCGAIVAQFAVWVRFRLRPRGFAPRPAEPPVKSERLN